MIAQVVITRPIKEAQNFAEEIEALGLEVVLEPVLEIEALEFEAVDVSGYQGLIFTSVNGVRAFGMPQGARDILVYVVGERTGMAAREAGFSNVVCAKGNGEDLAALIVRQARDKAGPFLHVRGAHVAQPLDKILEARGFAVQNLVVYEARAVDAFSDMFLALLDESKPMAVTLFSKRTAKAFVRLMEESGTLGKLRSINALCLSQSVLECVQNYEWACTYASDTPNRAGMVALLKTVLNQKEEIS